MAEENKAPWTAQDFDAEKAWTLVQNLRAERDELKSKVTEMAQDLQERDVQVKAITTERDEIAAKVSKTEALLVKENLLAESGLPRKFAKYIGGEDESEWAQAVADMVELRASSKQENEAKEPEQPRSYPDPGQNQTGPTIDENTALANSIFGTA